MNKQVVLSETEWSQIRKLIVAANVLREDHESGRWQGAFAQTVDVSILFHLQNVVESVPVGMLPLVDQSQVAFPD